MRSRTRVFCFALAFTIVIAGPAGATTSAPAPRAPTLGGIGLRLVDVPAIARDDPRARLYIVDHLAPGATIHRRIEVSNTTASTAHVALYAAAAEITHGEFTGDEGRTRNDLSAWTSLRPGAFDVPAGGRMTAAVTIDIPRDAAPGEQYAVAWAEVRSTPLNGEGVTEVSRVGLRLYVSVGPGGPPAANFTIDSLTAERSSTGNPMIVATVHNTGGRALDMNGSLRLSAGPGGLRAGPFPARLGTTLAIGDTEPVTIALDKRLPAGPWSARVTLRSGLLERSARATVTFPHAGASPAVKTKSSRFGWLNSRTVGVFVLLLLGIAAVVAASRQPSRSAARRAAYSRDSWSRLM